MSAAIASSAPVRRDAGRTAQGTGGGPNVLVSGSPGTGTDSGGSSSTAASTTASARGAIEPAAISSAQ